MATRNLRKRIVLRRRKIAHFYIWHSTFIFDLISTLVFIIQVLLLLIHDLESAAVTCIQYGCTVNYAMHQGKLGFASCIMPVSTVFSFDSMQFNAPMCDGRQCIVVLGMHMCFERAHDHVALSAAATLLCSALLWLLSVHHGQWSACQKHVCMSDTVMHCLPWQIVKLSKHPH